MHFSRATREHARSPALPVSVGCHTNATESDTIASEQAKCFLSVLFGLFGRSQRKWPHLPTTSSVPSTASFQTLGNTECCVPGQRRQQWPEKSCRSVRQRFLLAAFSSADTSGLRAPPKQSGPAQIHCSTTTDCDARLVMFLNIPQQGLVKA